MSLVTELNFGVVAEDLAKEHLPEIEDVLDPETLQELTEAMDSKPGAFDSLIADFDKKRQAELAPPVIQLDRVHKHDESCGHLSQPTSGVDQMSSHNEANANDVDFMVSPSAYAEHKHDESCGHLSQPTSGVDQMSSHNEANANDVDFMVSPSAYAEHKHDESCGHLSQPTSGVDQMSSHNEANANDVDFMVESYLVNGINATQEVLNVADAKIQDTPKEVIEIPKLDSQTLHDLTEALKANPEDFDEAIRQHEDKIRKEATNRMPIVTTDELSIKQVIMAVEDGFINLDRNTSDREDFSLNKEGVLCEILKIDELLPDINNRINNNSSNEGVGIASERLTEPCDLAGPLLAEDHLPDQSVREDLQQVHNENLILDHPKLEKGMTPDNLSFVDDDHKGNLEYIDNESLARLDDGSNFSLEETQSGDRMDINNSSLIFEQELSIADQDENGPFNSLILAQDDFADSYVQIAPEAQVGLDEESIISSGLGDSTKNLEPEFPRNDYPLVEADTIEVEPPFALNELSEVEDNVSLKLSSLAEEEVMASHNLADLKSEIEVVVVDSKTEEVVEQDFEDLSDKPSELREAYDDVSLKFSSPTEEEVMASHNLADLKSEIEVVVVDSKTEEVVDQEFEDLMSNSLRNQGYLQLAVLRLVASYREIDEVISYESELVTADEIIAYLSQDLDLDPKTSKFLKIKLAKLLKYLKSNRKFLDNEEELFFFMLMLLLQNGKFEKEDDEDLSGSDIVKKFVVLEDNVKTRKQNIINKKILATFKMIQKNKQLRSCGGELGLQVNKPLI